MTVIEQWHDKHVNIYSPEEMQERYRQVQSTASKMSTTIILRGKPVRVWVAGLAIDEQGKLHLLYKRSAAGAVFSKEFQWKNL